MKFWTFFFENLNFFEILNFLFWKFKVFWNFELFFVENLNFFEMLNFFWNFDFFRYFSTLLSPPLDPIPFDKKLSRDHLERLNYVTRDYMIGQVKEKKMIKKFDYPIVCFKLNLIPRKLSGNGTVCEHFESVVLGLVDINTKQPLFQAKHVSIPCNSDLPYFSITN